jgi:hypothetical protein
VATDPADFRAYMVARAIATPPAATGDRRP